MILKIIVRRILVASGICLATFGCSDETEFQKSIFIRDPENPQLPRYSEKGYNTFGAYYDRQAFTSDDQTPMKVYNSEGITSIILDGQLEYDQMTITINMNNFNPGQFSDLIELDEVNIDLTNTDNYSLDIYIDGRVFEEGVEILDGTFDIKSAKSLLVDKQQIGVILSGTFEFEALINGVPVTVSNGRFDVNIGESNFYSF